MTPEDQLKVCDLSSRLAEISDEALALLRHNPYWAPELRPVAERAAESMRQLDRIVTIYRRPAVSSAPSARDQDSPLPDCPPDAHGPLPLVESAQQAAS